MESPLLPSASSPSAPGHSRARVLVVDDQPLNIQALYRVFADDCQVLMATSGEKALQISRSEVPDLILLDVVMPEMDGYEVLARLKADEATADIPVIFVTARDAAEDEARGLTLGAIDYIAKPINPAIVRARTRTHLELARSRALLASTLEATADGIVVTDTQGRFVSCNGRFLRMWDIAATDLTDSSQTAVLRAMQSLLEESDSEFQSLIEDAGHNGVEKSSEVVLRDGRVFQRHLTPLRTSGRVAGVVFSFRDITARVRAERALSDLNASLETKVRVRTESLARATQIASEASQAKSEFLSNMSHEMRTPLNSVLGMAYLALRADPEPRVREYLERIHESGRHLLGLISNVLDFAKIEAGRLELECTDFSVQTVLSEVRDQLVGAAGEKRIQLSVQVDKSLGDALRGDPLRLRQVLLNFASNAIKFSEGGLVELRARVAVEDITGVEVMFEVEDHGIGMSDMEATRVFNAFEQADASTTRKYGGTGLGLAICRQLAELMGGEVGVSSKAGEGSTFWARIPFVRGETLAAQPDVSQAWRWEGSLAGRTLLVVDDNVLNQRVASELLQTAGARVLIAENGAEALRTLVHHQPDAVLMDLQMPVMDGLEASRRIREAHDSSAMLIIAMTANARPEDQEACLDAGMNDFVTKPVDPENLYSTLTKWLGRTDATSVPAAAPGAKASPGSAVPAPTSPVPAGAPAGADWGADAALDLSVLSSLTRHNTKMMRDIAAVFIGFMGRTVTEMQAAVAAADRKQLGALGHKAKSSAASVGANGLSKLCHELELAMKDEARSLDEARALVDRIGPASAAVCSALAGIGA